MTDVENWEFKNALSRVCDELQLTQKDLAKALGVSASHVSGLMTGAKKPSVHLVQLLLTRYDIRQEWLDSGEGDMFHPDRGMAEPFLKRYFPTPESRAVLSAIFLAPFMPVAAAGLALGAGASQIVSKLSKYSGQKMLGSQRSGKLEPAKEIVDRMCKYSGVETAEELAKTLEVRVATISDWKRKNKIPSKYIKQVAESAGVPEEIISHPIRDFSNLGRMSHDVVWEILEMDRKERINYDRLSEILTLKVIEKVQGISGSPTNV